LRERERFRAWFYAVLLSVHRERARRSLWRRFLRLEDLLPADEPPDPRGHDDDCLAARRVADALAGLPAAMREAIVLYEVDGFSVEEIASMQKVSLSAVKSRLARGRDRLRRRYERLGLAPAPLEAGVPVAEGKP
jgi:RNA polymerase sigma-70 factor (ECF subfamily)